MSEVTRTRVLVMLEGGKRLLLPFVASAVLRSSFALTLGSRRLSTRRTLAKLGGGGRGRD